MLSFGFGGELRTLSVEARKEVELPEVLACSYQFLKLQWSKAVEFPPQCATALVQTMGQLREFDEMMAFVRKPPPGVERDVYMYTQALHALAHDIHATS